jgi:hypothetical protein
VPFVVEVQLFSRCVAIFTVFITNIASNHSDKVGIIWHRELPSVLFTVCLTLSHHNIYCSGENQIHVVVFDILHAYKQTDRFRDF